MRYVAVACYLIRCVHNNDSLVEVFGHEPRHFAKERSLADARPSEEEDAFSGAHEVFNELHCAEHCPPYAAGEAYGVAGAVPHDGYAVQRALYAGAVVVAEHADLRYHRLEIGFGNFGVAQFELETGEARLWRTAQVQDDLDQLLEIGTVAERGLRALGQDRKESVEVIDYTFGRWYQVVCLLSERVASVVSYLAYSGDGPSGFQDRHCEHFHKCLVRLHCDEARIGKHRAQRLVIRRHERHGRSGFRARQRERQ